MTTLEKALELVQKIDLEMTYSPTQGSGSMSLKQ